jgi:hypothetical protein
MFAYWNDRRFERLASLFLPKGYVMDPVREKDEVQKGNRYLIAGMLGLASVVVIGTLAWVIHPVELPRPATGPGEASISRSPVLGRGQHAQDDAESSRARTDPAGLEDEAGGKARAIKETSGPTRLSDAQRQQIRQILSREKGPHVDSVNFELMIGTAVPRQVRVADIPPEITKIMAGYWGDQYLVVQDKLVIVDQHSGRVGAIINNVAD